MDRYPENFPRADLDTVLRHLPERLVTTDVLRAGHARGLITDRDIVAFFLGRYESESLAPAEEAIALLLSDDFDRIPALLEELAPGDIPSARAAETWTFVTVANVRANWAGSDAPWEDVELAIFAWGDLPEWQWVLSYMPPPSRSWRRRHKPDPSERLDEFLSRRFQALITQ